MNASGEGLIGLIVALAVILFIWLVIRGIVLWYFRINRIVELLEQIERNTRPDLQTTRERLDNEEEYYSRNDVRITNKRIIIPPNEWQIGQFQPVKVESTKGKYRINLFDKSGREIHYLESDNEERINLIAEAINKAVK